MWFALDRPVGRDRDLVKITVNRGNEIVLADDDRLDAIGARRTRVTFDGFETGATQNLSEFTFTLQRMLAAKIISRLEFRRDMSSADVFPYRSGPPNHSPVDSQNTFTLGLIYAFSSADAK